jgi:DeoR family transcriptional regulator, fructose operon transcriptional repressor
MSSLTRQQAIMRLVRRAESVSVLELVDRLEASPATVRRDLVQLEEAGKIVRTHGAVVDRRRLSGEPSFSVKRQRIPGVKRRIGRAVAERIRPGASVFVDAGTTCLEAGLVLLDRGGHTVYTNSLPLLYHANGTSGSLIGVGGEVRAISGALVGAMALDWLNHLRFDYAVIGASALEEKSGPLTTELKEAAVKKLAVARARTAILAADSSKFAEHADVAFAQWSDFDLWLSDGGLPGALSKRIKKQYTGLTLINLTAAPEDCEKLMYARRGQTTPTHAHKHKKEDVASDIRLISECEGSFS